MSTPVYQAAKETLSNRIRGTTEALLDLTRRLVATPSENPPGDTRAIAQAIAEVLRPVEGVELDLPCAVSPIVNVVARVKGNRPGRRLIFNGHLDTYPVGNPDAWSVDPFVGEVREDRLYGRGVADMKGGIACSIWAFMMLAELREAWSGELVLVLAGDEETMGCHGTQYLLETVPHTSGDAMICGDAGSPLIPRFGEKGMLWLVLEATGKSAHGAHVHMGESAIDRMIAAMVELIKLRDEPVVTPPVLADLIERAKGLSEQESGQGEARTLQTVTVNFGIVSGGSAPNLIADYAKANVDIRVPAGVTLDQLQSRIAALLDPMESVTWRIERCIEANWTSPDDEIVQLVANNCRSVLNHDIFVNMRVGASDSRLYRRHGVPTVVCGLTPHNMGAPDEFVSVTELFALAEIHGLTALDFLGDSNTRVASTVK